MRSIDQRIDHLKNQILDGLTQKGILNELQSRFLSNVAQFIQTTDYDVFKPHRERRQTPEYEIAEIIVAQYLKTKNMMHTLQSIINEFKIDEKEIDIDSEKSSGIVNKMKIEKNGLWIHQITNDWIKNKEVLIKQNKEYDRKVVQNRLYQIDNKSNIENNNQIDENSNNDSTELQKEPDNNFNIKTNFKNKDSNQLINKTNKRLVSSLKTEGNININPDWVINEDSTKKDSIFIQEEEEFTDNSDSQENKPGQAIWVVDSPKDNVGSSGGFISDDEEPPSIFSKKENDNETDNKPENSIDINLNTNNKESSNEKTKIQHNIFLEGKNEDAIGATNKKSDTNPFFIDTKLQNNTNIDDFDDFNLDESNENDNNNQEKSNNITNTNINEQNSIDFDVDFELEDDAKTNNQKENKVEIFDDKEEDIFEDKIEKAKDKKEKLLSNDLDEPEKTQKKEINNDGFDDFDDFEEFNDDFDQETVQSSPKSKQNIENTKIPTNENKKQNSIISSGSDIDFENLIDSDPSTTNSKSQTNTNSVNKTKNQGSDSSIDFDIDYFEENNKSKTKKQPQKQTKKIGSNSSIDFDIDFSDDSPTKEVKSNKKEQKNNNNTNESNQSDFDDFDDTSI